MLAQKFSLKLGFSAYSQVQFISFLLNFIIIAHCNVWLLTEKKFTKKLCQNFKQTHQNQVFCHVLKLDLLDSACIAWNNFQLLVEVKYIFGGRGSHIQFKQVKIGPKLDFFLFSQVWFINFPLICIERQLVTIYNYQR